MATRTQLWSPDTCRCQVELTWDDAVDPSVRTHTYSRTVTTCPGHAALAGLTDHLAAVFDTNRRKNLAWAQALSVKATLLLDQFVWSYDAAMGVLTINLGSNLTTAQKTSLQNFCNTQFGSGKVVIL